METDQIELSEDPKKVFEELVKKALKGKQSDFEFIRTYEMCKTARLYKISVKRVFKAFKTLYKKLMKTYAKDIMADEQKLEMLMSMKQFEICYDYYKKEYELAKDMLSEYHAYLSSGHIFDQLVLNGVRSDDECVDYRELPWTIFQKNFKKTVYK